MRIIMIVLVLALVSLQYKLWVGDGSIRQWLHVEKKRQQKEAENNEKIARSRAIEADIRELKSGDQALEEQARFELGMIKEGEVYYQFVD